MKKGQIIWDTFHTHATTGRCSSLRWWCWPGRKKQTTPIYIEQYTYVSPFSQIYKETWDFYATKTRVDASWIFTRRFSDFLLFYGFMLWFWMWTHFSWEFQGGHICTNSFKHVFIALRAESRVLGREELTMWPRHKKIETSSQPPRCCCSWILHIAYLPSQLPSWLHFLNKASTNTKEYYVSYLNIFLPRKAGNWKIKGKILGYLLCSI